MLPSGSQTGIHSFIVMTFVFTDVTQKYTITHNTTAFAILGPKQVILRIHVTSPILGERISAITLTQQRKQWLSVE